MKRHGNMVAACVGETQKSHAMSTCATWKCTSFIAGKHAIDVIGDNRQRIKWTIRDNTVSCRLRTASFVIRN